MLFSTSADNDSMNETENTVDEAIDPECEPFNLEIATDIEGLRYLGGLIVHKFLQYPFLGKITEKKF